MAYEVPGFKLPGHVASADLSTSQFLGVVPHTTAGEVALAGAAAKIAGVLQNDPIIGEAAEVMVDGVTKGVSGAAITTGDELEMDAAAKFITLASGVSVGFALEAASGADDILSVLLK
ncbi:unnamed protein product [marine sediment metagenome]|uniref:DUF2190 domain-containing protein n=1 Tax=marine sediment metagenome TaxID=412755 RepID=X0VVT0_9ZZZZ